MFFKKNAFSKASDKFFGTKLMCLEEKRPYRFSELKNAAHIEELKNMPKDVLNKTQKAGMGLYAHNLVVVMATLGFGLPYGLNKLLSKKVFKDKMNNQTSNNFKSKYFSKTFEKFLLKN